MKKYANKLRTILVFSSSTMKSFCEYGISFAFAFYATDPLTLEKIYQLIFVLILLFSLYLIVTYIYTYNSEVYYSEQEINIDKKYFDKLLKMNIKKITEQNTGFIRELINNYNEKYRLLLTDIIEETIPFIIGIGSFLYIAFKESIIVGLISIVVFLIIIITRYILNLKAQELTKDASDKISKYKGTLIDFISNIKTVIKLNSNKFSIKKIKEKKI